jgi:WXG100 family type VII secretion target
MSADARIIRLHHDQIDAACRHVTEHVKLIDDELDTLEATAGALAERWTGEAQAAYADAHRKWDASMRELTKIANELSRITHEGNTRFREHDQREAKVWAR